MGIFSYSEEDRQVDRYTANVGIRITVAHLALLAIYAVLFRDDFASLAKISGPSTALYTTTIAVWFTKKATINPRMGKTFTPQFVKFADLMVYSTLAMLLGYPVFAYFDGMHTVATMQTYNAFIEAGVGATFGIVVTFLFGDTDKEDGDGGQSAEGKKRA